MTRGDGQGPVHRRNHSTQCSRGGTGCKYQGHLPETRQPRNRRRGVPATPAPVAVTLVRRMRDAKKCQAGPSGTQFIRPIVPALHAGPPGVTAEDGGGATGVTCTVRHTTMAYGRTAARADRWGIPTGIPMETCGQGQPGTSGDPTVCNSGTVVPRERRHRCRGDRPAQHPDGYRFRPSTRGCRLH